ncbi:MAG: Nif11 family protein [Atopobiaceae bacterium]|nr:Nif11 family protein [Atopobiaceae bacterium]
MTFDDLTEEQKAKALACETTEDVLALAKEIGYELSDEELEAVNGGIRKKTHGTCIKVCAANFPWSK